jgi:hypothetical protein
MKRSNLSIVVSLTIVFVCGCAAGALVNNYFNKQQTVTQKKERPRTPEEFRRAYVAELTTRLKLSSEQEVLLKQILDETGKKFDALRERLRPEMRTIEAEQVARIRAMLDDTQRDEYEKFRKEREDRRKRDRDRGQKK